MVSAIVDLKARVIHALEEWGDNTFTFAQLRTVAGVDPDSPENDTLWNFWRSLQETGAVAPIAGKRKRHKLFRVKDAKKLHAFRPLQDSGEMPVPKTLEQRVAVLEQKLEHLEKILLGRVAS